MSTVTVTGIQDLRAALANVTSQLRKRILRNALAAGGRLVRDAARRATPVLAAPVRRGGQVIRKPDTVRKAISVRTSKTATRRGDVGVFVNVRPAKGAVIRKGAVVRASQRGATSPDDPFYWQWLNFGRKGRAGATAAQRRKAGERRARVGRRGVGPIPAFRFLERGATQLGEALRIVQRQVPVEIQRLNRRKA